MWCRVDTEGIIQGCNQMYAGKTNFSKDKVVGKSIFDHVAQESMPNLQKSFEIWKDAGKVYNMEIWLKRKNSAAFPVLLSASSTYDKEGIRLGCNAIMMDISEIHELKHTIYWLKIKKLQVIGELTSRISHDIRNPLAMIKNGLELIKIAEYQNLNDRTKDWLEKIGRGVERINYQVENVLDYVNPRPLRLEDTTVSKIVNDSIEDVVVPATTKIQVIGDSNIRCDTNKIHIVFANLISNAIQAMNGIGGITIQTVQDSDETKITVTDTGPGIPLKKLGMIFDPLFTTRQIGTGLGLTSCKAIIEQHGGSIEVDTELGKYARFTIRLPKVIS
jgi:PAS domain S-box-containing protein